MSALRLLLVALAFGLAALHAAAAAETPVPRVILAFYDGNEDPERKFTRIHQMAEMPLNHLGLVVRYHDISRGLPADAALVGVRGFLTWFGSGRVMEDPVAYLRWATRVAETGRRFVILGNLGFTANRAGRPTAQTAIDRFFGALGVQGAGGWKQVTYDVSIAHKDPRIWWRA